MKNKKFFHEFVLLLLLGITIGAIAIQSNLNFTGLVVNGEGVTCDGDWTCNEWTECADSSQTRTCAGINSTLCSSPITESQSCEMPVICTENWTCNEWTECADSSQTRTCADSNSCGTTTSKPIETQTCEMEESDETEEETTTNEVETTTTEETITEATIETPILTQEIIPEVPIITCTPDWKCGEWQECINGNQIKICLDGNNCGTSEGEPVKSQSCIVEIKETCSDKIKNQDETSIDCGGVCKKCGIFTIAGSVINGPLDKVKETFSNKITWIVIFTLLGLGAAGFFGVRFFSKHKIQITKK